MNLIDAILKDFSYWLPKAKEYGYSATELYFSEENFAIFLVPIPIVERDYKFWLFCFYQTEVVNQRIKNRILAEIGERFDLGKYAGLVEKATYFIIADSIRGRIIPAFGRKSVYAIRSDYSYKVYEIISKALLTFVSSFRKNVKYGEDLLRLCDDLQFFAERMEKRADELKSTTTSPTHHPSNSDLVETKEEAEEYLALLERGVMK